MRWPRRVRDDTAGNTRWPTFAMEPFRDAANGFWSPRVEMLERDKKFVVRGVKADNAKATFDEGVLEVVMQAAAKKNGAKQIEVK